MVDLTPELVLLQLRLTQLIWRGGCAARQGGAKMHLPRSAATNSFLPGSESATALTLLFSN